MNSADRNSADRDEPNVDTFNTDGPEWDSADLDSLHGTIADRDSPEWDSADVDCADVDIADLGIADLGIADLGIADLGIADLGIADEGIADAGPAEVDVSDKDGPRRLTIAEMAQEPPNDTGNGRRLVGWSGADMRYSPETGWHAFNGRYWPVDENRVIQWAKEAAERIWLELEFIHEAKAQTERLKHSHEAGNGARLRQMLWAARTEPGIWVPPAALDADPFLLNCRNGTVDLRTGKLREHRREDLITGMCPVEYDPDARLDLLDEFLDHATGGDEAYRRFLQRCAGYSLTGSTAEEVLFFIYGPGKSGKSTFIEMLKGVLGGYAKTADFEAFIAKPAQGGARNDIARLAGARLVASVEVDDGRRLAEGLVKMLTGGDVVTARLLYKESFEFVPQFKLWLCAHHTPRHRDDYDAKWRRVLRLPFPHAVEKKDPRVKAILRDPKVAGPAVLAWMVQGCLMWQQEGLNVPQVVEASTASYRADQDPLKDFLEEHCVLAPHAWTRSADLWATYERWARNSGVRHPFTQKSFTARMMAKGCIRDRKVVLGDQVRIWKGVGLQDTRYSEPADEELDTIDTIDTSFGNFPFSRAHEEELPKYVSHVSHLSSAPDPLAVLVARLGYPELALYGGLTVGPGKEAWDNWFPEKEAGIKRQYLAGAQELARARGIPC